MQGFFSGLKPIFIVYLMFYLEDKGHDDNLKDYKTLCIDFL